MSEPENPHAKLTEVLPLAMYGDMIVEAYQKMGLTVAVSIHVGDLETGAMTGSSNLPPAAEMNMLQWIIAQRERGGMTHEEVDYEHKGNPKENLN